MLFENTADDLERVERLFKYIEYFMLPQFNAPRNKTTNSITYKFSDSRPMDAHTNFRAHRTPYSVHSIL